MVGAAISLSLVSSIPRLHRLLLFSDVHKLTFASNVQEHVSESCSVAQEGVWYVGGPDASDLRDHREGLSQVRGDSVQVSQRLPGWAGPVPVYFGIEASFIAARAEFFTFMLATV